eukprot:155785-Prymnesium_polylepis.1
MAHVNPAPSCCVGGGVPPHSLHVYTRRRAASCSRRSRRGPRGSTSGTVSADRQSRSGSTPSRRPG